MRVTPAGPAQKRAASSLPAAAHGSRHHRAVKRCEHEGKMVAQECKEKTKSPTTEKDPFYSEPILWFILKSAYI